MNAEDWRNLYAQGSDLVRVGTYTGERLTTSTHVPAGTMLYIKDPDEAWARIPPTTLKWTIPVWCHKADRWMSFDLKDKDWSQHLVEWREFQLEQPEKGCKPVPPAGWEVPDDWNRQPIVRWESNRGHVIHGIIIKTSV